MSAIDTSGIDETKPATDSPLVSAEVRGNFNAIKTQLNNIADAIAIDSSENIIFPSDIRAAGFISSGTFDTTAGVINVYGGPTATDEGGQISLYACADYDTVVNYFYVDVNADRLRIGGAGIGVALHVDTGKNVVISELLATTATDGFLYIPTCAGTPTGVPTTWTGRAPIVFDTTNNKLYVYDGSWLSTAALT